jgi:hypothetical protein
MIHHVLGKSNWLKPKIVEIDSFGFQPDWGRRKVSYLLGAITTFIKGIPVGLGG